MPKVYVIHENAEWMTPLRAALDARQIPFEEWHLASGTIDLSETPPDGVFYSRMSASSHTRGHRFAPEFTGSVLAWLEAHGRRATALRSCGAEPKSRTERECARKRAKRHA